MCVGVWLGGISASVNAGRSSDMSGLTGRFKMGADLGVAASVCGKAGLSPDSSVAGWISEVSCDSADSTIGTSG